MEIKIPLGAEKILDEVKTNNWSFDHYQDFAVTDLFCGGKNESKVSWDHWESYFNKNRERIISDIKNTLGLTYYKDTNGKIIKIKSEENPPKKNNKESENIFKSFGKKAQAIEFVKENPMFFDKTQQYWFWNFEKSKYEITDKTQLLTQINEALDADVITTKERSEIINALELVGRKNIPENIPKNHIQFKNKIVDLKSGDEYFSTPKYFSTNPIPWDIGESEETPMMDKYFKEWVGEEYKQTLYEILAYSICSDQFMQRIFAFVGGGSNGKGTFIQLLKKFVGKENCASTELKELCNNQFETSSIYKKLVCEMGEVSHDDLKNTNQIKKLSGQDDIRYCFKGKTPFTEESPTTCFINTNSLPTSRDKTTGFYRRWLIIDFPNQFKIKEGIIELIPNHEFNNLAKKSVRILKEMYSSLQFTNEGDMEERANRYEERSNPIMKFIEDYCEEDYEAYISLKDFMLNFNKYLKEKHLRPQNAKEIKKNLTAEGYEISRTRRNYIKDYYISCLKISNYEELSKMSKMSKKSQLEPHGDINQKKVDILDILDNNQKNTENLQKSVANSDFDINNPTLCQKCNAPVVNGKCIGCTAEANE